MPKKNSPNVETEDPVEVEDRMTIQEARAILASGTATPLERAHATRRINADAREKMPPTERAKADYADYVNDAADRIFNGGKRTIFGACGRFSAINRETNVPLLTPEQLNRGLDYLSALIQKCRDNIGVTAAADKPGFEV